MNDSKIRILLSSDSDYEKLIAEIYYEDKFIALLNQDEGLDSMKIEFPDLNVKENLVLRKVDLEIFEEALKEAKRKIKAE